MAIDSAANGASDMNVDQQILRQYDGEAVRYQAFLNKVAGLLTDLLDENGLNVHYITSRVKARESLQGKLNKSQSKYSSLSDITDIAGIRITTYLEADVEKVAEVIEREFLVDTANSDDKGALLDPDRFGYLSRHHVVSFTAERCGFPEYRRFPGLKAEIQTRSILQHAWAEIEHDLGYKSKSEVPRQIRRRFSRLAGLLELADQEFNSLRVELARYAEEVPQQIEAAPQLVTLDKASVQAFITQSPLVAELDRRIAQFGNMDTLPKLDPERLNWESLLAVSIENIAQLNKVLQDNSVAIIGFVERWLAGSPKKANFSSGICLFYLGYVIVAQSQQEERVIAYMRKARIAPSGADSATLKERYSYAARRVIETYNSLVV